MFILVTGGAGFIGSHLVDTLVRAGHRITVLDDLSTGDKSNLQQHQGSLGGALQNPGEVGDVGREGRQVGGSGLFVAHVREDVLEEADAAALGHRQRQSAANHPGAQPERLEQDRLSTGIGTRDHQTAARSKPAVLTRSVTRSTPPSQAGFF